MKQFPMDPANIKHLILQVDVETSSLERNVIYSQKNFLRDFLSPGHDRVVPIKSWNFFYCESLVLSGFMLIDWELLTAAPVSSYISQVVITAFPDVGFKYF